MFILIQLPETNGTGRVNPCLANVPIPLVFCFRGYKMGTLARNGLISHCVKSVQIRSFSGPYFPAFGLNTERCRVSLHIQSEWGKIWTRKKSVFGHFSRSVREMNCSLNQLVQYFLPLSSVIWRCWNFLEINYNNTFSKLGTW